MRIPGIVLLLAAAACGCGDPSAGKRLDGAGSSFVDPMMQEWAAAYKKEKGVSVNYQSKGSGAGIKGMTSQDVHFGCSDAPLNDEQVEICKERNGEVIHVPLCMGAIVLAYNLKDVPDLVFDGKALIGIFSGAITSWDDPAIAKLNPGKTLPKLKVTVARRSDASGSTFILTDYFTKVDKDGWKPGRGTEIKWPVGTGAKGTDGVASLIKQTEGTIGYVEQIYAVDNKLPFASVINASGKAIKPDTKSVTAAAATVAIPDDLRYSITDAPGEGAYPLAGTVWAIVYVKQPAAVAKQVKELLWWITHEGQALTGKLHYAALPDSLVKRIEKKLDLIK